MKQIYKPYTEWEDFLNGMWRKVRKDQEEWMVKQAVSFTSDHLVYGAAMGEVIEAWPITMINTLTNVSVNRKAFLGHCAVQYKIKVPEYITRIAWGMLTEQERILANKEAEKRIINWVKNHETQNRKVHKGLGIQMLFEWDS